MHAALRILRPGNAAMSAVAVWVGALAAGAPLAPTWRVALGAVAAFAFAGAGNVRNDLSDVEVDRAAHPERPLVTGALSVRAARALAIAFYALALLAAAPVSLAALGLVAVALPLMEGYERRLKREGLPGNLAIGALTAAPFVMGALAWRADALAWWGAPALGPAVGAIALLAGLATAGREVYKDVEDVDADRGSRRTFPMRVGTRAASRVAGVFLAWAVLLSPLPWLLETVLAWPYLPAVAVADACFLIAAATGTRRPARAQRLAKLGMVAALAALVIGRAGSGAF